jgi:CubicO group peptidase (beta-lactamase class C family)
MNIVAAFGLIVVLSGARGIAQPAPQSPKPPADCSAILAPIVEKAGVPGMVAAIVRSDGLTSLGAAGIRAKGAPEPVTTSDSFHMGSCTKAMTATLIGMLVEEGKLSWSTTIADVFPDRVQAMNPKWRAVTVEQLLTHRSGAPADLNQDDLWSQLWNFNGSPVAARLKLLDGVTGREPAAAPGSKFIYSNAGFAIAGAMAEKTAGKPWEDLMRERLFTPLDMTSAGFGAPGTPEKVSQPRGHHPDGTPVPPGPGADNPAAIGPAGTVHCTISDWAKFVSLHLAGDRAASGAPGATARLLKPESFRRLHTPAEPSAANPYAMGWGQGTRPWAVGSMVPGQPAGQGRVLTHSGSNTMWFCVVWMAPERDFAALVACNQGGDKAAAACDQAAWAIIQDHLKSERPPGNK